MGELIIVSLLLMFLVSNAFWLYHYNKLLNKFMCRNYHEYISAEKMMNPEPRKPVEETSDAYEAQRARELNQMTGMV